MNRYDFVYLFDVKDGNPNGDPDAGNLPRVDPETGHGLVTDVCLKRKIRNFVAMAKTDEQGYDIYVTERAILNDQHDKAWQKVDPKAEPKDKKKLPSDTEKALALTGFMCKNFFDIRAFGAVMTTDVNCGQVRGPVQFGIARSIDPIFSLEHSVTRCAVTTARESEAQGGGNRTMGRKFNVPYALYRVHGFINPFLADDSKKGTGFSESDLDLLKHALGQMFDFDRSAARGEMTARRCIAFKHDSPLGNARAATLFDRISVQSTSETPRSYSDYEVSVSNDSLHTGITMEEWV